MPRRLEVGGHGVLAWNDGRKSAACATRALLAVLLPGRLECYVRWAVRLQAALGRSWPA